MNHLIEDIRRRAGLTEARKLKLNKTEQRIMKQLQDPTRGTFSAESWSYWGPRASKMNRGGSRDYKACESLVAKGLATILDRDSYRVSREPGYMEHVSSISIKLAP